MGRIKKTEVRIMNKNMKEKYDVIIVGAGIAGLGLANELRKSNLSILVLDSKKKADDTTYDTLGSSIDLTFYPLPKNILHPINKNNWYSKNEFLSKTVRRYIIERKKLLKFLENSAKVNPKTQILYQAKVVGLVKMNNKISAIKCKIDENVKLASAKIYVDCSGISRILAKKILPPIKFRRAFGMECVVPLKSEKKTADLFLGKELSGGYGWIFPKGNDTAILGVGIFENRLTGNIEKIFEKLWDIDRVKQRCKRKIMDRKGGMIVSGKPIKNLLKDNLVCIGDSALQSNPLFGEGVRFVLEASQIAAEYIRKALQNNNLEILENYQKEWLKKYYKSNKYCYWLQRIADYFSSNNKLCDYSLKKLTKLSDADFDKFLRGDIDFRFFGKLLLNLII